VAAWLTDAEIEFVLSNGQLEIADEGLWRREQSRLKFTVGVGNNQDVDLMLSVILNPKTNKFTFALYYPAANQALRRYCSRGGHRNPGSGELVVGQHKHGWQAATEDRVAYVPPDITEQDIVGALRQFLAECNVTIRVEPPPPPAGAGEQLSF
jgi:hypothetical protein